MLDYVIIAVVAYLLGSVPTGFLVARAKGIDIRTVGSGNIGATNAMRVLGKPAGICVLLIDALKGYVACCLGALICIYFGPGLDFGGLHSITGFGADSSDLAFDEYTGRIERCAIIAGIFAVLGHNYTCWLKFKGGKGIATSAGVYLALAPWAVLIAAVVFLLSLLATRYVSVGSISAAVVLPAAVWILPPHNLLLGIVTTVLGALAIYKHKGNIQRLIAGTENRLRFKKKETT
ncbi:MAG: glycerol-3-phosphate 1-O-acyltransferase PlsY [Limisphaerales bacterium]